mgnify:CR=1 FL=1
MNKCLSLVLLALISGCVCSDACKKTSCGSIAGNYGLEFEFDNYKAGHMILGYNEKGEPTAKTLVRWSSPEWCEKVKFDGNSFSFYQPKARWSFEGKICGDKLCGKMSRQYKDKKGQLIKEEKPFKGWKNPPVEKGVKISDAKFGEPIDLLADGLDGWEPKEKGEEYVSGWSFKDGVLSNRINRKQRVKQANLLTKRSDFMDFKLSYDVRVPKKCNSGVFLRGRYEIQVIDSYGKGLDSHNMAAFYGRITPSVAAEKPAGEWQHVDVTLYRRHVTIVLNGKTIIDNQPVEGVTGGAIDANEFVAGPMYLQGDHSDADFKNMILTPIIK